MDKGIAQATALGINAFFQRKKDTYFFHFTVGRHDPRAAFFYKNEEVQKRVSFALRLKKKHSLKLGWGAFEHRNNRLEMAWYPFSSATLASLVGKLEGIGVGKALEQKCLEHLERKAGIPADMDILHFPVFEGRKHQLEKRHGTRKKQFYSTVGGEQKRIKRRQAV